MLKKHYSSLSLFLGVFIAISPDSQQIVTFSPETNESKLYEIDNLSSSKPISTLESGINDKNLCWSIAISNCVDNSKNKRFIALSCFDARKFRNGDNQYGDDENDLDLDSGNIVNNRYGYDESDLESCGKVKNKNDLESGNKVNNQHGDDPKSGDKYLRPQTWVISTTDENETYTTSIGGVIRFLDSDDSSLKNKTVIIIVNSSGIYKETMNNLTRKQRFFSQLSKIEQFELPKQLSIRLRVSRDHWQNSLELLHTSIIKNHFMVHSFENRQQIIEMYSLITGDLEMLFKRHESSVVPNIIHGSPIFAISHNEKILAFCRGTTSIALYFMENGLEITTKQLESQRGIYKIVAINFIDEDIWDLFTTFENSIRQTKKLLKMDGTPRLLNSNGTMFVLRDSGEIFSVLDHPNVALIRNPSTPSEKTMTKFDSKEFKDFLSFVKEEENDDVTTTNDPVCHAIYTIDGKRCDTLEKSQIIIDNVEPWHYKNYFRISVYLDSTESTQLIISRNTIQVWKYSTNNTIEKRDKHQIAIRKLKIGEREFVIKVLVPSSKSPKTMKIHWPNNVNVLEEACRALYVLDEKKHTVVDHESVNQIKYLIECTQRLIRKYVTKYSIFRLTSIRNSNIYIPRLYQWADEDNNRSTTEISKSDLHYAILCIQKRGDSTVILKYLIDYYADNTKEYNNYGWMFTVSKVIPLLYDNNLREFIQYLFKKPCFGITEAYTPPLHINPYDRKKGNNADVLYSLAVKPCLAPKFRNSPWFLLKNPSTRIETSYNDRKVYIVPLPDFTVYPNLKDLEVHKKDYEIYQTPTIMAVLNFKWSAARRYYTRHIIMYIVFGISYTLEFETYYSTINLILFLCLGYFRYIILHNPFIPFAAFTALIMWLELLFLFRYFEVPGRFVYIFINILNTIWPFFASMLSADLTSKYKPKTISNLISSIKAVFFWTNGRWEELYQSDSYVGNLITIIGGAFDEANKKSRTAAHRYRTERIEALEKPFSKNGNPRYIYYIPNPDMIDTWLEETKKDAEQKLRLMSENLAELTDFDYSDDDDDGDGNDDDDNQDNTIYSRKYQQKQNESSSSNIHYFFLLQKEIAKNWKSNNKSLNNDSYNNKNNKSSNEPLFEDPLGSTTNVDNQLSMQERFKNLENEFKKFKNYNENFK
ncbi:hypothetical protein Glove_139g367 [Diversispora epigaea]|uniref:Ion transport domain-containing protein n=1 Tax=Diversispora epigaea TaxID=1348612 RepID=A0A397J5J5_9GLOM|nr:hypothetical protein Glove_139g367 [Diversispora epigaea]